MLPKEEKIGSNKLINRLIKHRGKTGNKPVTDTNESFPNIRGNSPEQKYLIPKITK